MIDDGDLAGSIAKLLATYPETTRTPAESFVLGNALFEIDRKVSYTLHKTAFTAEPANAMVLWEWAMEQHRAGEYEAALATYQAYSKLNPRRAASYALQADCLLRLNRIDDATAAWRQWELAPEGSIEGMESLVCSIHRDLIPYARRDELLKTAIEKQDANAAADLITLDCEFPKDWWTAAPDTKYLQHDLPPVMTGLKLPANDVQARAMACAADCATSGHHDATSIEAILSRHHLIADPDQTFPDQPGLLGFILAKAMNANLIDAAQRPALASKVLDIAIKTRDARAWMAEFYVLPTNNLDVSLGLLRQAWDETHDAEFMGTMLALQFPAGKLTADDVDLQAALRQFPENGAIQRVRYVLARQNGKLTKQLLADAARAEFTHFSGFIPIDKTDNRTGAGFLREYFHELAKMSALNASPHAKQ